MNRERGSATTEVTLVVPVLMLMILLIIQFGIWYHASHVVEAAAQDAARSARVLDGSTADGHNRAASVLAANAADLAGTAAITVTRTSEVVRVEVRAVLPSIVPGIALPVQGLAESPIERFRSEVEP